MPQFLIPPGGKPGDLISFAPKEARHLRDILRLQKGEKIRVTDGQGRRYLASLRSVSKKEVTVLLEEPLPEEAPRSVLEIGQALLKKDKMEWVIQKAVELGAETLIPFVSSRTVVKLKDKSPALSRWQRIADEAVKQSGRGSRMIVQNRVSFDDLIHETADLKIIFWEEEGEPVREFFRRGVWPYPPAQKILALIGPEGGFSLEEIEQARHAGFAVLSLGQRILRAETAAIVAMSLIQYELGNF
jgi:16S rRNA (uracil1498-N3)-methyltransferase